LELIEKTITIDIHDCKAIFYFSEIAELIEKVIEERDELNSKVEELEDELQRLKLTGANEDFQEIDGDDIIQDGLERKVDSEAAR